MIPGLEPIPVTRPLQIAACLTWVTKQPDVRRNLPNFGRLLLLLAPAKWIGQASCCLCGVGVFPGSFWVACTFNYALGQIGRCDIYLSKEVEAAG